jgi:GAF domain-containing protein
VTVPNAAMQALVTAAVDATGAAGGWLLQREHDELVVRAAHGDDPGQLIGRRVPLSGTAGFVVSSSQPLALSNVGADARFASDRDNALLPCSNSVLSVPCSDEDQTRGVLEIVDKAGGAGFSYDDLELVTLLADIAGPMLAHTDDSGRAVPEPHELADALNRLAVSNPIRYAALATAISSLLAHE